VVGKGKTFRENLLCIAHRGASGVAPENTLLAVQKALDLGAPWIEVDVQLAQGELLVFHDRRLERTTNGQGYLAEKSLAYLRSLDAGQGEKIPLLREVLDLIGPQAGLNIELKGSGTAEPVATVVRSYLAHRGWSYDRLLVSSFDLDQLNKIKNLLPELKIGPLVSGPGGAYPEIAQKAGAYSVHIKRQEVSADFVADAHARGLKVFVYTVNTVRELERLQRLGVDGIFTDYPELFEEAPPRNPRAG
jgi:glycerophosphoryl diester phosphodiesterase